MAPAQVVALEDLCVLKLIGEVEHYSLAQLVLLPWHLRQKLLRSLPLADICRLETNSLLTRGIDMDAVWGDVCTRFLDLLSPQDNVPGGAYLVRFEQLARPKDTVMAMIAKLLLISTTGIMATAYALRLCTPEYTTFSRGQKAGIQHFQDKWGIIRTLLFCSHRLSIDDVSVSMNGNSMESFVHIKLFPTTTSWQPKRHSIHFNTRLTSIAEMGETFLSVCNAVPKVLRFRQHDSIENLKLKSPESKLILQSILSGVEEFSIDRSLPQKVPFCSASLQQVLEAVTSPSTASLKSLRVKGVPFFLKELIQDIAAYLAPQIKSPNQLESTEEDLLRVQGDGLSGYTNLRKFEFLSCHPEEREVVDMQRDEPVCLLSTAIPSLLGILNSQAQLKEVHIDHLYDLTKEGVRYDGFGILYSSLRHFIRSPHFHLLRIANCHIPLRIAQQLLDTFAHSLTTHPTTLDISKCLFDVTFSRYFSRAITEEDHHRISSTQYSLCEEQHKSLSIPYGIFSNTIALPKVKYERLQISVVDNDIRLLDLIEYIGNFEPQPKALDIHILSYSPIRKDLGAINKILAFPNLTNFGVGDLGCETCELLDHLSSALGEHSSTANTLQGLSLFITAETAASSYQQVYEAVFSLPQLEEFSLELTFDLKNCQHHFKYLTEAWRATSRGGKLLNLTGLELDENSVNDFVGVGRQIAEKVRAFDKFYQ